MYSQETGVLNDNLKSWSIDSISSSKLVIDLSFVSPPKVSQGTEYDTLFVILMLGDLPDKNGAKLFPQFYPLDSTIPPQLQSSQEKEKLDTVG